jgi:hypothetical protein
LTLHVAQLAQTLKERLGEMLIAGPGGHGKKSNPRDFLRLLRVNGMRVQQNYHYHRREENYFLHVRPVWLPSPACGKG